MKVKAVTLGCKVNAYESNYISESLQKSGFLLTQDMKDANIIIINTCTVTNTADSKCKKYVRRVRRENENSILDSNIKSDNKKEDLVDMIIRENTEEVKEEEEYNDEEGELLDLESLTEKLKNEEKTDQVKIDKYEQEQEEKAIISYDELLSKKNHYAINYEKEEQLDDITVKKVNLNDLVNKNVEDNSKNIVQVISYQKEEDFLKALKELNSLLN